MYLGNASSVVSALRGEQQPAACDFGFLRLPRVSFEAIVGHIRHGDAEKYIGRVMSCGQDLSVVLKSGSGR